MSIRYIQTVDSTTDRDVNVDVVANAAGICYRKDSDSLDILDPDSSPSSRTWFTIALSTLSSITAGVVSASKALIADAQSAIAGLKVALGSGLTTTLTGGLPGVITDPTSNASGTTQSTEYTLNSVTLPASAFDAATRSCQVVAWGTLAANANAKTFKIYFGGTAIATLAGSTASGKDFLITLDIVRTGLNTQSAVASIQIDTGTAVTMAVNASVAETETAPIIIAVKSANTAAAAASATGKGMIVSFGN